MKEDTLAELAKKLKISKSTVSKAIRHCSGVDSETRQLILDALPKNSPPSTKKFLIYTIVPDVPQYFWKELHRGLLDNVDRKKYPIKQNVYTRATDESTVLQYLSEAEEMDIKVLIISVYVTPRIRERLERLTERCMVILLTENFELCNSFFIGSDAYRDGYAMGKEYLAEFADRRLIYFSVRNNGNAEQRSKGFFDAIREEKPEILSTAIPVEFDNTIFRDVKNLSSRLASLLSNGIDSGCSYCLYSPIGLAPLPIALKKTGLEEKTVCMCHDSFAEDMTIQEGFHICCNQDVYMQGAAAAKAAIQYVDEVLFPENKYLFIPSRIRKAEALLIKEQQKD